MNKNNRYLINELSKILDKMDRKVRKISPFRGYHNEKDTKHLKSKEIIHDR